MQVTRKETVYEMPGNQPNVGDKAADFRLKSLEDKEYTLTDFLGKPTIISVVPIS